MEAHITEDGIETTADGFVTAACKCGFICPPVPDVETAVDILMEHAYDAGRLGG